MRKLRCIRSHGITDYRAALSAQRKTVEGILADTQHPCILHFLEHPRVITLGRAFQPAHLLTPAAKLRQMGIEVIEISRGGSVTCHAPGQLVVYLHLHLRELNLGLKRYFRELEQWVIDFLALRGLQASTRKGMTGVWVENQKICAMGVAAKKYVSYHGLAINLNTDLGIYRHVIPCGLENRRVTSLRQLTGTPVSREQCEDDLLKVLPSWLRKIFATEDTEEHRGDEKRQSLIGRSLFVQ